MCRPNYGFGLDENKGKVRYPFESAVVKKNVVLQRLINVLWCKFQDSNLTLSIGSGSQKLIINSLIFKIPHDPSCQEYTN